MKNDIFNFYISYFVCMPLHHSTMSGSHKTGVTQVGSLFTTCGFQASIQVIRLGGKHFYLPTSLLIGQMTLNVFKLSYFTYTGILLLCMPMYHKLRFPAEQSELLTAESSQQPSQWHLVSSTEYCTFTSSHSEGADDECVQIRIEVRSTDNVWLTRPLKRVTVTSIATLSSAPAAFLF